MYHAKLARTLLSRPEALLDETGKLFSDGEAPLGVDLDSADRQRQRSAPARWCGRPAIYAEIRARPCRTHLRHETGQTRLASLSATSKSLSVSISMASMGSTTYANGDPYWKVLLSSSLSTGAH